MRLMESCGGQFQLRPRILVIVAVASGLGIVSGLRQSMANIENGQMRIDVQRRPVEGAAFKVELKGSDYEDAIGKNTVFKAEAVKIDRFVVKALIHN